MLTDCGEQVLTAARPASLADYLGVLPELTKIRLVALVLWSTAVGYFLAAEGPLEWPAFVHVLGATGLVAAGSLALNQWAEREYDALMERTAHRPIPAGRIKPAQAFWTGMVLSAAGLAAFLAGGFAVSGFLAAFSWTAYLLCYTPLKRKTALNTLVGALPGALPPLIGWSGARGYLTYEAWLLFTILFLWQLPHFLAIAWLYREDYRRAGFVMLSLVDADGTSVGFQAVVASAVLLPVSLLPVLFGMTGAVYFFSAALLGFGLLAVSLAGLKNLSRRARSLFGVSIFYLAMLLFVMMVDKA